VSSGTFRLGLLVLIGIKVLSITDFAIFKGHQVGPL
jgi:hypothetical protein